jgi:hypothetical protein
MGTATVPSPGSADATNAIAEPARGSAKAISRAAKQIAPGGLFLPGANALDETAKPGLAGTIQLVVSSDAQRIWPVCEARGARILKPNT